ncbi:hypothetical protein ACQI4L_23665 [Mycolicibacterium litorale]|uniref:hypothetical protein n=1 Tax=Mycolicibacterium litorale TaxID=758802 RepID=UPI003CF2E894
MAIDMRRTAACAALGMGIGMGMFLTAPAAGADPVAAPAPGPLPAPATVDAQAAPAPAPDAGVPHLHSPDNPPPGTSSTPVAPTGSRGLSYLRDLWHAVQTQEVSGGDAIFLLTQRPLDPDATPPPGMPAGPQAPLPPAAPAPAPAPVAAPAPAPLP